MMSTVVPQGYLCPKGYKQTEVGVIPSDWNVDSFSSVTPSNGRNGIVDGPFGSNLKTIHYRKSGVPIVTSGFVTEGHFFADSYLYVDKEKFEDEKRSAVQAGDIVMAKIGARCGASAILPEWHQVGILSGNALKITVDQSRHSTFYIWQVLWNLYLRGRMEALRTVGAQPAISMAQLKQFKIPLPPFPEQRAIATALSDVDALLAAQDKLITKKLDIKQAAMQQLLTGKQRLPGFSGEWVVKRFGDVGNCLRGVSYKGDADLFPHDTGNTKRLLRSNNVQNATVVTSDIQFVNRARVSEHQVMKANDILICMANGSKALVGKAGLFKVNESYEYTFGAFMGCFRTKTATANSVYVFFLFQTGLYRNYINNLLAGSSINNLKPSSIESLEFPFPSLMEQTAIATVLSDMDDDLTALEQQRDKTRALKQGMKQALLTGRIRLV